MHRLVPDETDQQTFLLKFVLQQPRTIAIVLQELGWQLMQRQFEWERGADPFDVARYVLLMLNTERTQGWLGLRQWSALVEKTGKRRCTARVWLSHVPAASTTPAAAATAPVAVLTAAAASAAHNTRQQERASTRHLSQGPRKNTPIFVYRSEGLAGNRLRREQHSNVRGFCIGTCTHSIIN